MADAGTNCSCLSAIGKAPKHMFESLQSDNKKTCTEQKMVLSNIKVSGTKWERVTF